MKKYLEELIDENGMLHIDTEMAFTNIFDPDYVERAEGLIRPAIEVWRKCIRKNRDNEPSKAVRLLSMAKPYGFNHQLVKRPQVFGNPGTFMPSVFSL